MNERPSVRGVATRRRRRSACRLALLFTIFVCFTGCAAAVNTALATVDIRKGIAGLQQLIGSTRSAPPVALEIPEDLASPLAGTYRGFQVVGHDTVHLYVRTTDRAAAPIVDEVGNVTGYALGGIVATSLDSLEARVGAPSGSRGQRRGGRAMFFVEGTQAPTPGARALFPAAFMGQVAKGESAIADRHNAELRRFDIDMEAPAVSELSGRGIPDDLFATVAEGLFTLHPGGEAIYHQDYEIEGGDTLTLHFERISRTALPSE